MSREPQLAAQVGFIVVRAACSERQLTNTCVRAFREPYFVAQSCCTVVSAEAKQEYMDMMSALGENGEECWKACPDSDVLKTSATILSVFALAQACCRRLNANESRAKVIADIVDACKKKRATINMSSLRPLSWRT